MSLYSFSNDAELFPGLNPSDPSWFGWNTLMKVYDGIPLEKEEATFFGKVSGGLSQPFGEDIPRRWCIIVGAGGGKSRFLSRVIPYRSIIELDAYLKIKPLHPGQVAENIIVAPSIEAAKIPFDYVESMIVDSPLAEELVPERADSPASKLIIKNTHVAKMNFRNGSQVRVQGVSRITGRGRSIWTLFMDEGALFKVEGRFSDEEVYNSAVPRLGRFGMYAMAFLTTTPWDKSGLVWKTYKDHFGKEKQLWLVIQGTSKDFNPTLDDKFLAQEEERDPQRYKREILAQFVDTVYGAFSAEAIEDSTVSGRKELRHSANKRYFGFMDAAGLSMSQTAKFNDEWSAGVAHCDNSKIVIDAIKAWKAEMDGRRVTPDDAANDTMSLFEKYRVREVMCDQYGAGYNEHKFTAKGYKFERCKLNKSDLYLSAIPMINDGIVELLDEPITNKQLKALERKRGQYRDQVIHPKDAHDDRANVVAGLIYMVKEKMTTVSVDVAAIRFGGGSASSSGAREEFRDIL